MKDQVLNVAAYRFTPLAELSDKVEKLQRKGIELGLKGSLLVTPEGLNVMLAGSPEAIWEMHAFLGELDPGLRDIDFKQSWSRQIPFRRYLVKEKDEVIKLGMPEIQPLREKGAALAPKDLKSWFDDGRKFTLLDTRNDYEIRMGTFKNAIDMRLKNFTEFPEKLEELPDDLKKNPLVMFCTGGVRCERASLVATRQGFEEVYQLDGGILRYFEKSWRCALRGRLLRVRSPGGARLQSQRIKCRSLFRLWRTADDDRPDGGFLPPTRKLPLLYRRRWRRFRALRRSSPRRSRGPRHRPCASTLPLKSHPAHLSGAIKTSL